MKAIAINGSARANGNTEVLLKKCLSVLAEKGIEGEIIRLSGKTITPCKACGSCSKQKNNRCIMEEDDFQDIYDSMRSADIILLGSPVYFGTATGNMTALLDRVGYVARANGNVFSRKVGGPVVVARRAGQNFTLAQLLFWFMIMDMVVPGSTYWNIGFGRNEGEVNEDMEGLETIGHFAENLAWLSQKIDS
ncbi:MAG: flavodoxin family protein [Candidatus Hydrogenedentes bacterium]|nr:flavodoxin family protein [Candidatus Hydrogenedentota bacterium]